MTVRAQARASHAESRVAGHNGEPRYS